MGKIRNWLKTLMCTHIRIEYLRDLHGDQIIEHGWKRQVWRCRTCGKVFYMDSASDRNRSLGALIWKLRYTWAFAAGAGVSWGAAWGSAEAWMEAFNREDSPEDAVAAEFESWEE